jgi:hypothetical protein
LFLGLEIEIHQLQISQKAGVNVLFDFLGASDSEKKTASNDYKICSFETDIGSKVWGVCGDRISGPDPQTLR